MNKKGQILLASIIAIIVTIFLVCTILYADKITKEDCVEMCEIQKEIFIKHTGGGYSNDVCWCVNNEGTISTYII